MAAKSKKLFNYIAHVQMQDGTISEMAGAHEETCMRNVYLWLLQRAEDMGGWLVADKITDSDEEIEEVEHSDEPTHEATRIGAIGVWGHYTRRYSGASRLTFKEQEK